MPTLEECVAEMLTRVGGDALGRKVSLTDLTTTTAVVSDLATGTVSSQKFVNKWMWRPDTADTADLYRVCSAFAPATGTLTHAGTNYADTDATSEDLYILEYEPFLYIDAIQQILPRCKYVDRGTIPTVAQNQKYEIPDAWTWIQSPADVKRLTISGDKVLNRNRFFTKWGTIQSTGAIGPDDWTLAGSGATMARSTTFERRTQNTLAVTRSGTNCTLTQTVPILHTGVTADNLEGETLTASLVGLVGTASTLRLLLSAGATSDTSDYHSGDSTFEEMTASIAVPAGATSITLQAQVNDNDDTAYLDECYVLETASLTDHIRRGEYEERDVGEDEYSWDQGAGALQLVVPQVGRNSTIGVYSHRPYPTFNTTRVAAGSANGDSTDCPIELVAVGAIWRLYEGLGHRSGEDSGRYLALATEWRKRWENMALAHTYMDTRGGQSGIHLPPRRALARNPGAW